MKIRCNREKLYAAFQTAAAAAPSRSPKPILQNVKLDVTEDSAIIMATDLEVGIRLEVGGIETEQAGAVVLPIDRFGPLLRESSDETLTIESDENGTVVKGERSVFKLPSEDPNEFPQVTEFTGEKFHEVPARLLKELIRRTIFATDNESSRYALGGVLLELGEKSIAAIATDGRRLAVMEGPAMSVGEHSTQDKNTIVPTRAMQMIERTISDSDAEIQIAVRDNDILVKSPRATLYSRLVEGRYPRWRDVFPRRGSPTQVQISVGPFLSAVSQAMIVTSEESRGVDFTFSEGNLTLGAQTAEKGQTRIELPIAFEASEIKLTLDPRYVRDFLKVIDDEKSITMEVEDQDSAAVFSSDDGYRYVVMPLARDHGS